MNKREIIDVLIDYLKVDNPAMKKETEIDYRNILNGKPEIFFYFPLQKQMNYRFRLRNQLLQSNIPNPVLIWLTNWLEYRKIESG